MNNLELINEIKQKLQSEFPGVIEKVILFGSQATGIATEDSDHDILIIVNKEYDWNFKSRLLNLIYDFDLRYDILIDTKLISLNELQTIKGYQPFILKAFEQGIAA